MIRHPITALCLVWSLLLLLAACGEGAGRDAGAFDPYAEPPLPVLQHRLAEGEFGAPRELLLFLPAHDGDYPLLQFQHGFVSDVDSYTDLLSRLAGFGFVVAAPQMYVGDPSSAPGVAQETAAAVVVLEWAQASLNHALAVSREDQSIRIRPQDSGLLGHSRGGQVAWRMLFDHPQTTARAIAGVDPVDGDAPPFPPGETGELVTDDPGAFQFPFASLIIGMGQGASGAPGFECAPTNRNYRLFYEASLPPRYELVAENHGHSDMLDGDSPDLVCPGALDGSRAALRRFVAGQLAAYFLSALEGRDLLQWHRDPGESPVPVSLRFEEL